MSHVIKIVSRVDGATTPHDGQYLCSYKEFGPGVTRLITTNDPAKAKLFDDAGKAWEYWRQQSTDVPLRPWDQKPNRPLTAFNVLIERKFFGQVE